MFTTRRKQKVRSTTKGWEGTVGHVEWTEIRCLAVGKAPMNSTVPCTPILAVGSRIDGRDDMNRAALQCPATMHVVQ
jgi:hypothetical protein